MKRKAGYNFANLNRRSFVKTKVALDVATFISRTNRIFAGG